DAVGLIGRQGVHRVQQDGFDAAVPGGSLPDAVVQHRVEEGLGLSGAGTRGQQGGVWRAPVCRRQAIERRDQMPVRYPPVVWPPVQQLFTGGISRGEGRTNAQERPTEHAGRLVTEEPVKGLTCTFVGEGVRGRQVLQQALLEPFRLQCRSHGAGTSCLSGSHSPRSIAAVRRFWKTACASRISCSLSTLWKGTVYPSGTGVFSSSLR